jgi:hypothetical protein
MSGYNSCNTYSRRRNMHPRCLAGFRTEKSINSAETGVDQAGFFRLLGVVNDKP